MLPQVILDIITSYVDKFNSWESLPDPKAVKRLIRGSDSDLLSSLCGILGMPEHMYLEIRERFERNQTWLVSVVLTVETVRQMDEILSRSISFCWKTHAVFWLFIQNPQNIYHGCYTSLFEGSLLFQILNIVTNQDFLVNSFTEPASVYLGTDGSRQQVAVYHLL